ncbi:hypothetical protein B566_EDAN005544 [Ephemera danica]|nr:hypothetical protein B566_EDAN005544 [Ephemera danica]
MGVPTSAWLARLCGGLLPAVLPPLHMAVLATYWKQYARRVDRRACTCGCWDTIFKGTYETGVASYKHMYFNATRNTLHIWLLTVAAVIGLYEATRYLVSLALERRLRLAMAVLFCSVVFSHYYSWWSYVNYWNDEFYAQWGHQLFFSVTELVSTLAVLRLADRRTEVTANGVLPIVGVAAVHILAAGKDQFVENVIEGQGLCYHRTPDGTKLNVRERREFLLRVLFAIVVGLTVYSIV